MNPATTGAVQAANYSPKTRASKLAEERTLVEQRRVALSDCFAMSTWIALGFALLCLAVDGFAMFVMPHHPTSGEPHGATVFAVTLWTLEIVLALLALWLVRYALSQPPRFIP